MEIKGVEPLTSCLQGRRSSQLSYIPIYWCKCTILKVHWKINNKTLIKKIFSFSLERRWSSRTFRYGYLVTTSPQSPVLPSAASSLRLDYRLRVPPALMVWRAVCTRPGNVFTAACWSAITSNSDFMWAGCSPQSELGLPFRDPLQLTLSLPFVTAIVARV